MLGNRNLYSLFYNIRWILLQAELAKILAQISYNKLVLFFEIPAKLQNLLNDIVTVLVVNELINVAENLIDYFYLVARISRRYAFLNHATSLLVFRHL